MKDRWWYESDDPDYVEPLPYAEPAPHPRVRRVRVCESCGQEHVTGVGSLCELCDDFVRGAYRDWLEGE